MHHGQPGADIWTVEQLEVEPAVSAESARWFNDRAHAVYAPESFAGALLMYSAKSAGQRSSVLTMGQLKAGGSAHEPFSGSLHGSAASPWGQTPQHIRPAWHGSYQCLRIWLR
jgi:hypothetical protein